MAATAQSVKELRDRTGAGVMDCKEALQASEGDLQGAVEFLRKKGLAQAAKRSGREAREGVVGSYVHPGAKLGVLIEVNCETDFVARTDGFQDLVKDLSMQVAAAGPRYVSREDVPAEELETEREIYLAQARQSGKPEKVIERIIEGQVERFYKDVCLLEQPFIKQSDRTVEEVVKEAIVRFGVNVAVRRFARFQLGESLERRADNKETPAGGEPGA